MNVNFLVNFNLLSVGQTMFGTNV